MHCAPLLQVLMFLKSKVTTGCGQQLDPTNGAYENLTPHCSTANTAKNSAAT